MNLITSFILFSAILGLTAGDHITPGNNEVISTEGQTVTLSCTYDTSYSNPSLYWYSHHSNQAPQFILWKGAKSYKDYENIPDKRYNSRTSDSSTELIIQQLTLSDTALYYCAVDLGIRWDKLLFGKPISLTVKSNKAPVLPTLSILSPADGIEGGNPEVCLAAGFLPKDGVMSLSTEKNLNDSLSTSTAALASTNTFYFARYSKERIENCEMSGVKVDRTQSTGDDAPTKGSDSAVPAAVTCKDDEPLPNAPDAIYPNYTKVNFTSLVVYGLRIVFAKAVAFNVLFTVKALVF